MLTSSAFGVCDLTMMTLGKPPTLEWIWRLHSGGASLNCLQQDPMNARSDQSRHQELNPREPILSSVLIEWIGGSCVFSGRDNPVNQIQTNGSIHSATARADKDFAANGRFARNRALLDTKPLSSGAFVPACHCPPAAVSVFIRTHRVALRWVCRMDITNRSISFLHTYQL